MENAYEGWTNRNTWAIALRYNNEESLYLAYHSHGEFNTTEEVHIFVLNHTQLIDNTRDVNWEEIKEAFNESIRDCERSSKDDCEAN